MRGARSDSHRIQGGFYELFQRKSECPAGGAGKDRGQAAPEPRRPRGERRAGRELLSHLGAGLFPSRTPIPSGDPDLPLDNQTAEQQMRQKLEHGNLCFPFKRHGCDQKFTDARERWCQQDAVPSFSKDPLLATGCVGLRARFQTSPKW